MRGFDASSAIFVDNVRDLGSISRDMFNIQQVEVSRAGRHRQRPRLAHRLDQPGHQAGRDEQLLQRLGHLRQLEPEAPPPTGTRSSTKTVASPCA
jgi:hypothetical protein